MSPWSRERLRIAISPHTLALARLRGYGNTPIASKTLSCDTRDWQSLLLLLETELADAAWRTPRVEVVLSNHFVRYVITPASGKALTQAEEAALVAATMREIYGAEATQWRIRVHSQPPDHGLVGAAIDERLASRLNEMCAHVGAKICHLLPLTTLIAPHSHRDIDWWVLAEPGWLCVFHATNGYWHHLSAQAVDADWPDTLPHLLDREARMAGLVDAGTNTQKVLVHTIGLNPVTLPATTGWHWQIAPSSTDARGAIALAMA